MIQTLKLKIPVFGLVIERDGEEIYLTDVRAKILKSSLREEMQALEDSRQREARLYGYRILPGKVKLIGEIEYSVETAEASL